jgi:hypothetical protein
VVAGWDLQSILRCKHAHTHASSSADIWQAGQRAACGCQWWACICGWRLGRCRAELHAACWMSGRMAEMVQPAVTVTVQSHLNGHHQY